MHTAKPLELPQQNRLKARPSFCYPTNSIKALKKTTNKRNVYLLYIALTDSIKYLSSLKHGFVATGPNVKHEDIWYG